MALRENIRTLRNLVEAKQKLARSIPKDATLLVETSQTPVASPGEFLVMAATTKPAPEGLSIYGTTPPGTDQWGDPIPEEKELFAGIMVDVLATLPSEGLARAWYWPVSGVDPHSWDPHKPRYASLLDALILSMREHGSAAYVMARARGGIQGAFPFGLRLRTQSGSVLFWDNPDFLAPGSCEKWWTNWFNKAKVGPATAWKGSDDPMT